MNLNPAKQTILYGHHFEFCNFIGLYKNKKLPNKILLSGEKGIGKSTLAYHIINRIYLLVKNILMTKKILQLIQKISHLN